MHILQYIHEHAQPWIESGGYGVLFGLLFACGLGLPLPEDIPLIIAGGLISQHHMRFEFAAPIAWLGIIGGDCVLYSFGYRFGHGITSIRLIGKHVTLERLRRAELLFAKFGVWMVAVGRMFAGIRGAMVVAAGVTRLKFFKFLIADGLAAIVSGGTFMFLGYWFGNNASKMREKIHEFRLILFVGSSLAAILLILYMVWRSRRHSTLGDDVAKTLQKTTTTAPINMSGSD